ncbi:MAG: hypothetical protein ACD_34C00152G0001 [uncultured bacterium]|nr:MAG: hypothetical protein ACD_34C00152G0001 [uncultured bacterium]
MVIPSNGIKSNHYFRFQLADIRNDLASYLIKRCGRQRPWVEIVDRPWHARIAVVEHVYLCKTQCFSSTTQFILAQISDAIKAFKQFWLNVAHFSTGGADQMHFHTLAGIISQRSACSKSLIIRMSQHNQ